MNQLIFKKKCLSGSIPANNNKKIKLLEIKNYLYNPI